MRNTPGWKTAAAIMLAGLGTALLPQTLFARGEEVVGVAIIGAMVLFFLLFFGAIYAYFALAISTIARKTHTPNAWYAWIPILNMVLLLNVAQKPVWWLLLFFVPFINIVILVLTWMGVAKARGRPDWWGLLIMAPIANFILPGILAWSDWRRAHPSPTQSCRNAKGGRPASPSRIPRGEGVLPDVQDLLSCPLALMRLVLCELAN